MPPPPEIFHQIAHELPFLANFLSVQWHVMGTRHFCVGALIGPHPHTMLQPGEGPTHYCYGATALGVLVWNPVAFHFSWCVTPFLSGSRSVKGAPPLLHVPLPDHVA